VGGCRTLKVEELKRQLKWRGLDQSGLKPGLVARLKAAIEAGTPLLERLPRAAAAPRVPGAPRAATGNARWTWKEPTAPITRPQYEGPERFMPSPDLGLTSKSHPKLWFDKFISAETRKEHAANSQKYRGYLMMNGINIYPRADPIGLVDIDWYYAMHILNGLNPVANQRMLHRRSFAVKGVRAGDLLTRDRWTEMKAFFHVSDPANAPKKGTPQWDELHKIRPLLESFLNNCIANITETETVGEGDGAEIRKRVRAGKRVTIDEITVGFQGHHGQLKQRCGKFKRAGDGFQASTPRLGRLEQ